MLARTFAVMTMICLPAVGLAQKPDPLAGLMGTSLAPGADALDANSPLAAAFLSTPYFAELAANPEVAASNPSINAVLDNPVVIAAMQHSQRGTAKSSDDAFLAALPPTLAAIFDSTGKAPTTGNAPADIANANAALAAIPGVAADLGAGGSRKMLQA